MEAVFRPEAQRRGFVHVDAAGERTITVIGDRLGPRADDPLPWDELAETDAVYFTAGDAGAARPPGRRAGAGRDARAGSRRWPRRAWSWTRCVASGKDPGERYEPGELEPPPRWWCARPAPAGASTRPRDGERGRWEATPLPGPVSDLYGCGDSFAAGVTYGLGAGLPIERGARAGCPLRRRLRDRARALRRSAARGLSARPRGRRRARSAARPLTQAFRPPVRLWA